MMRNIFNQRKLDARIAERIRQRAAERRRATLAIAMIEPPVIPAVSRKPAKAQINIRDLNLTSQRPVGPAAVNGNRRGVPISSANPNGFANRNLADLSKGEKVLLAAGALILIGLVK